VHMGTCLFLHIKKVLNSNAKKQAQRRVIQSYALAQFVHSESFLPIPQ